MGDTKSRVVVLDTCVLVAGLRSSAGASYRLLQRLGQAYVPALSVGLVLEYEAVLKRQAPALGLSLADIDDVIDYVCAVGRHQRVFYLWRPLLSDPCDDMVVELAVAAGCECIVTHNTAHLGRAREIGMQVATPRQFERTLEVR